MSDWASQAVSAALAANQRVQSNYQTPISGGDLYLTIPGPGGTTLINPPGTSEPSLLEVGGFLAAPFAYTTLTGKVTPWSPPPGVTTAPFSPTDPETWSSPYTPVYTGGSVVIETVKTMTAVPAKLKEAAGNAGVLIALALVLVFLFGGRK